MEGDGQSVALLSLSATNESGTGGIAYVVKAEHQLYLARPHRLQIEFSRVSQQHDTEGGESGHLRRAVSGPTECPAAGAAPVV